MKQTQNEKQLNWCFKKGEEGGEKHHGLRKTLPNQYKAQAHIQRAIRNLEASKYFQKGDYEEWSVSATFYAMYHALLAILAHFGYESKNQQCTFATIRQLITENKISLTQEEITRISGEETADDIISLREYYQYGTETTSATTKLNTIQEDAKNLVDKIRIILQQIK